MGTAHDEKKSENVRMKMQEGFLWGGATAANQCEGSASAGPSRSARRILDESAEKQQNSVRMC